MLLHRVLNFNFCGVIFAEITMLISPKKSFQSRFYNQCLLRKYREQIVQSSVSCDVILDPKRIRFFISWELAFVFDVRKIFDIRKLEFLDIRKEVLCQEIPIQKNYL